MRLAALVCGLVAGLFALVAAYFQGEVITPFLHLFHSDPSQQLVGTIIFYSLPAACLIAGLLALLSPGTSGMLMLLAAAGWLTLGLLLPHGFTPTLIVPLSIAAFGSLIGFFAPSRRRWRPEDDEDDDDSAAAFERDEALRLEPGELAARARMAPQSPVEPMREPDLAILGRQLLDEPPVAVQFAQPEDRSRPAPAARVQPDPEEDEEPLRDEDEDEQHEDDEADLPQVLRAPIPAAAPTPSARDDRISVAAYREDREPAKPTARDREPPAPRDERKPRGRDDDREPAGGRGLATTLALVNSVMLLILFVVVGFLLFTGYQNGMFGSPGATQAVAVVASTAEPDASDATGEAAASEADAEPVTPAVPPALALPMPPEQLNEGPPDSVAAAEQAAAAARAAQATPSAPQPVATAAPTTFDSPFSYCAAVQTIDYPDARYSGPLVVKAIADGINAPASTTPDRLRWRCFEGQVLACTSFDWPTCAMTPSIAEMVEYCGKHPNAAGLQAPNGYWKCNGPKPEIPPGEAWPVDDRGFLPDAWKPVAAPQGTG